MRTRPATIVTVVIAVGLALTSVGLDRGLPYTFGGVGSRSTIAADLWAHGTAISPPLVALVVLGLLAAIAMRPTLGGQRASAWLSVLAVVLVAAGLAEPVQQQAVLLGSSDLALTALVDALHVGLIVLAVAAFHDARAPLTVANAVPPTGAEPFAPMPSFAASAASAGAA